MNIATTSLSPRSGNLGVQLAAHLLRRSSFHFTKPHIDALAAMTATAAVNQLFDTAPPTPYIPRPLDPNTFGNYNGEWIDNGYNKDGGAELKRRRYVTGWWFRNALHDPTATHKLAFFIHTFYTVSYDAGGQFQEISRHFYDHLLLLNYAAENNMDLKTLAKKMTLDCQMLFYLDGRLNKKVNDPSGCKPSNENYSREFLELFTIGRGEQEAPGVYTNYTEADVNAFAKILTGFKTKTSSRNDNDIDPDTNIRRGYASPNHHCDDDKIFSNKLGNATITGRSDAAGMMQELEDFIDVVFNQAETARNYARKIYRYYVDTEIDANIESAVIQPLANHLTANNFNLVATIKYLLKSEHFYAMCASAGGGNIVKSPIELLSEAMSFFNTDLPALSGSPTQTELTEHFYNFITKFLHTRLGANAGLRLFGPLNVAGYPAYYQEPLRDKNWYNITTKPYRYELGRGLIRGKVSSTTIYTNLDTVAYANYLQDTLGVDVSNADDVVDAMTNYLLPQPLTAERRDIIKNIFLANLSPFNWQCEWKLYRGIDSCNQQADENPDRVRPHLDALVVAVLSSQEFQLK